MQPYLSAPEKHVRFQPRPGSPPNAHGSHHGDRGPVSERGPPLSEIQNSSIFSLDDVSDEEMNQLIDDSITAFDEGDLDYLVDPGGGMIGGRQRSGMQPWGPPPRPLLEHPMPPHFHCFLHSNALAGGTHGRPLRNPRRGHGCG